MATLEKAIAIAAQAHAGQEDKGGSPYILHPLRVMLRMNSPETMIVAVLHDVVEDCEEWSFDRLRSAGFSDVVVEAVECLTKREGERYEDFIERVAGTPLARDVKIADLTENMDASRLGREPTDKDRARMEKYVLSLERLRSERPVTGT
jgi:(p)ppGpp synthase/HD superfamily hydrolase